MDNFSVVVTTINEPTSDLKDLLSVIAPHGSNLVVMGDNKTPKGWAAPGASFFSIEDQHAHPKFSNFSRLLPENHYCRKNLGYLIAKESKVDWIFETDDDNRVYRDCFQPPSLEINFSDKLFSGQGWVNVFREFNLDSNQCEPELIWPRGFPIQEIQNPPKEGSESNGGLQKTVFPISQGLVDGDPDVDAIFRLTRKLPKFFEATSQQIALVQGSWSPFNSQNTWWHLSVLPLMYLPVSCNFRVTDILRSYVAQAILSENNMGIKFTGPSALQVRNAHNYHEDFEDEVPLYLGSIKMMESILSAVSGKEDISDALLSAYEALVEVGEIEEFEIPILKEWLNLTTSKN